MATLSLICHVERCPASDRDDTYCFSLNLSVALGADAPAAGQDLSDAIDAYLQPWRWRIESITAAQIVGNQARRLPALVPLGPPALAGGAKLAWETTLTDRLGKIKGDAAANIDRRIFAWPEPAPPSGVPNVYEYNGDDPDSLHNATRPPELRRWAVELLDLSREIAPLPQSANLSRYFFVNRADVDPAAYLVAVPVFKFDPDSADPARRPAWPAGDPAPVLAIDAASRPLRQASDGGGNPLPQQFEWDGDATDGGGAPLVPTFIAYTNCAPVNAPVNCWVPLGGGLFGEDWLGELEWRLADLFDLPGLLLSYLGTLPDNERRAACDLLYDPFRLALRDLVQTGATCGTRVFPGASRRNGDLTTLQLNNEIGLAGDVFRFLLREEKPADRPAYVQGAEAVLRALETWETTNGGPLDAYWDAVLKRVADPAASKTPETQFDAFRAWYAYVLDGKRARSLVLEQWDRAIPPGLGWWDAKKREQVQEKVFPDLDVRKLLALMHLGVRWADLVRALAASATQDEVVAALRPKLIELLTAYLRERAQAAANVGFDDRPRVAVDPAEPAWTTLTDRFHEWLEDYIEGVLRSRVLAGGRPPEELDPGIQPDAIVYRVAATVGSNDAAPPDPADPMRAVAGFGMLLREEPPTAGQPWCLNLADLYLMVADSPDVPVAAAAVAPVRMVPHNGVQRGLVSYHNLPICGMSPTAGLAQNHEMNDTDAPVNEPAWLTLANAYSATGPQQLPSLRFGTDYHAAAFRTGNGGILPAAIAEPEDLTRFRRPAPVALADGPMPWVEIKYRRRVAVGAVRFGSLTGRRNEFGDRLDLPPVPSTVHPLAQSLRAFAEQRSSAGVRALCDAADLADKESLPAREHADLLSRLLERSADDFKRSVVLLVPPNPGNRWEQRLAKTRFEFAIARPAVDLLVWDRSFDFIKDGGGIDLRRERTRDQRAEVWQEAFEKGRDSVRPQEGVDGSVDDPVVEQTLIRLTRLFPTDAPAVVEQAFDFPAAAGSGGLDGERGALLPCRIESGVNSPENVPASILPADATGLVRVIVPEGQVWLVEVFPVIPAAFQGDFQKRLWELTLQPWTNGARLGTPQSLLVEVATDGLPTAAQLHRAVRARAVAGGLPGPAREPWPPKPVVWRTPTKGEALRAFWRTEVALDPASPGVDGKDFHLLHRVAVLVQRWRWNGRPLRDVPEDAASRDAPPAPADPTLPEWTPAAFFDAWQNGGEDQAALTAWDGRLFGDRADTDYRRHEALVDFVEGGGPAAGAFRVFQQDVSTDRGALYFRYAVEAQSRYEGLVIRRPQDSRAGLAGAGIPEAWRRLVVPCRHDQAIPPPRIKLVLPLTDVRAPASATDAGESTPGLLVVLNEPWFRYGGLSEELVPEIDTADEPWNDTAQPQPSRRAQLGADPTVISGAHGGTPVIVPPGNFFPDAYSFEELPAYGPIGHTFDTDTLAPEFIHTSFVVPAPELRSVNEDDGVERPPIRDLAWYFGKLRFRRRLEPSGIAVALRQYESDATGPLWAQFLPSSSRFGEAVGDGEPLSVGIEELRLVSPKVSGQPGWSLARSGALATPVKLRPTPVRSPQAADRRRFQLWALVTETMFDAYGQRTQERFLDFCPVQDGVLKPLDPTWSEADSRPRRARLVEVQVLPSQEDALADAAKVRGFFFPTDPQNLTEARARCLRVSAPIDP